MYVIQHCFICRPSDSNESEDAGIDPNCDFGIDNQTTNRLDLIHTRLDLIFEFVFN